MQDVLTDVHSFSSAKTKTLTQLIDRVIASYNAVDDRDSGM